jgi:hypothetical protein
MWGCCPGYRGIYVNTLTPCGLTRAVPSAENRSLYISSLSRAHRPRLFRLRIHLFNLLPVALFNHVPPQLHAGGKRSILGGKFIRHQQHSLQFLKPGQAENTGAENTDKTRGTKHGDKTRGRTKHGDKTRGQTGRTPFCRPKSGLERASRMLDGRVPLSSSLRSLERQGGGEMRGQTGRSPPS